MPVLLSVGASFAASNSVTIRDTSGSAQNNRPFTISRVFAQGEFPAGAYPQARLNSGSTVPTQVDLKNTWPDGSVKHALVSFVATLPANGNMTVDFVPQSTSNNTGYLDKAGMLNYNGGNWSAQTQTSGGSADARAMLGALTVSTDINSSQVRYWMKGPIVTQVIVEDKSPSLAYDFGTDANKSLHPIFVLTFYPNTNLGVSVQYIVDNDWFNKCQDQTYSITLKANGATVFSKASFDFISATRWRKVFWAGAAPTGWTDETTPGINIDYNLPYMASSKALANYDLTKHPSAAAIASEVADYHSRNTNNEEPQFCVSNPDWCGSYVKFMPQAGGRGDLGVLPRWYMLYLYTFDKSLYPVLLGDGLASGRAPIHARDYDNTLFFDSAHRGTAFGRPVDTDGRPYTNAQISVGSITTNGWDVDLAHQPDMVFLPYLITGDWYFLEELQFWAARNPMTIESCDDAHWCRHGSWEFYSPTIESRGVGWSYRTLLNAAFISPDNTPEQFHFVEKLKNNIQIWEGVYNIKNGSFPPVDPSCPNFDPRTTTDKWCWGRKLISTRAGGGAPNTIGFPDLGDPYVDDVYLVGVIDLTKAGNPPVQAMFESAINQIIWGRIKELGYPGSFIQTFWSTWFINVAVNPAVNHFHIQDYVYPIVRTGTDLDTNQYIQSWQEWNNAYFPAYNGSGSGSAQDLFMQRSGDVEFGYPHIAYAALSYAAGITTSDGLSGNNAWTWIKTTLPNQSLQNDNPKWAIVPRTGTQQAGPCDLNSDGVVDVADVQLEINQSLGVNQCGNGDLDGNGLCNVIDVQRVVNAVLNGTCRVGR